MTRERFDPQLEQWKRSFASLYKRPPTRAEIAEYKLSRSPPVSAET